VPLIALTKPHINDDSWTSLSLSEVGYANHYSYHEGQSVPYCGLDWDCYVFFSREVLA